jgi:tRNA threonylcarbamoyl adenosine modification protein YeaZ
LLLAIDTSAGTSAAVLDGSKILSLIGFDDPFGHAENIGLAIGSALESAGVTPRELVGVAIGRGPAPYTGLRVGMAAGASFAAALELPLYGVITLDAVAHQHGDDHVVVVADAKRRELFVAAYESGLRVFGPEVMDPAELYRFEGYQEIQSACNAGLVGQYAAFALASGKDLTDTTALYLRSPDVSPSNGKRVTG